jgi:clan AA aspartic protease (TIGR02281 family)
VPNGFAHRWFSASLIFLLMVVSGQTSAARSTNCPNNIRTDTDFENCRQLADAGDTEAMVTLAKGYAYLGFQLMSFTRRVDDIPPDRHESLRLYTLAADLGNKVALRYLYEQYRFGGKVSQNQAKADHYLNKAAQYGSEWAMLMVAQAQEKTVPKKALAAYLTLARNDNCIAQLRLAQAYESGDLVKKNLTQSYFWFLIADADAYNRKTDVDFNVPSGISYRRDIFSSGYHYCGQAAKPLAEVKTKAEETLSTKLVQAAQDAATDWSKGKIEKLLPPPQFIPEEVVPLPPPKVAAALPAGMKESSPKLLGPNPADATPSPAVPYQYPSAQMRVALKQDGGTFVVPIQINGNLTLDFIVDSGAADVSIPMDVFSTLTRTGTIKDADLLGEGKYVMADGSTSQSMRFTIRSLKVGDKVVENVTGSVAPSQGTLLLGQSFLKRFKSWSINNTSHELLLETQ